METVVEGVPLGGGVSVKSGFVQIRYKSQVGMRGGGRGRVPLVVICPGRKWWVMVRVTRLCTNGW